MCVSTIGACSLFGKQVKTHGETIVESWFLLVFSQSNLSLYLKNLSRITFLGVGDHFQVPKVPEWTCIAYCLFVNCVRCMYGCAKFRTQYRTCTFRHPKESGPESGPPPPTGTCSFEHLRDLGVVPHPQNVIPYE